MSSSREYWLQRDLIRYRRYINQVKKIDEELAKYYNQYYKELLNEIKILQYTVIANNSLSNQAKLELAKEKATIIDTILANLSNTVATITTTYLVDNYISNSMTVIKALEKTLNKKIVFNQPNVKLVEEIIRQNWNGLTYSERIWKNSQSLNYQLRDTLINGVIKGSSYKDMVKEFSAKMGSDKKRSYTLIKTELKQAISRSDIDTYKRANIEEMEIINSGKSNVCNSCAKKNHRTVKVKDAKPGVNVPPFHPNCTCSTIPVIDLSKYKDYDNEETIVL